MQDQRRSVQCEHPEEERLDTALALGLNVRPPDFPERPVKEVEENIALAG